MPSPYSAANSSLASYTYDVTAFPTAFCTRRASPSYVSDRPDPITAFTLS
jgi:hypothetical protein